MARHKKLKTPRNTYKCMVGIRFSFAKMYKIKAKSSRYSIKFQYCIPFGLFQFRLHQKTQYSNSPELAYFPRLKFHILQPSTTVSARNCVHLYKLDKLPSKVLELHYPVYYENPIKNSTFFVSIRPSRS